MKKNLLNLLLCASILPCAVMADDYPTNTYINGGDPFTLTTMSFYNDDYGQNREFQLNTNEPVEIVTQNPIYEVNIGKADSAAYAMNIVIVNENNDTVYQSNSLFNNGELKTDVLKTAEMVSEPLVQYGVASDSAVVKGDSVYGYFNNAQVKYFDGKDTLLLGEPFSGTVVVPYISYGTVYNYKIVVGSDTTLYASQEKLDYDNYILVDSASVMKYNVGYSIVPTGDFAQCNRIAGNGTDFDYEHPFVVHIDYANQREYFNTGDLLMRGASNVLYPMFRDNEKLDKYSFSPNGYTFYINYYGTKTLQSRFGDLESIQLADIDKMTSGVSLIKAEQSAVNGPVYDLAGRKVVNLEAGRIYIQNGKKFMMAK